MYTKNTPQVKLSLSFKTNPSGYLKDMIDGYHCTKCTITYWPNQQPVKKSNRFETPGPNTDEHGNVVGDKTIPIAVLELEDIRNEVHSTTYKQQKLPAAYEALSRHGFKFITYEEK
jgi:hypothetical protein